MVKHPKTNSIQNFTIYKYNNNLCYMPMQFLCALLESYYSEYRKLSQAGRVLTTCLFVSLFAYLFGSLFALLFVCFLLLALLSSVLHSQLPPSRQRIHCVPALYWVPRPRSGLSIYVTGHHHQHHHCHHHHHRQYQQYRHYHHHHHHHIIIIPALFQLQPPGSGLSINRNGSDTEIAWLLFILCSLVYSARAC